MTPQENDVLTRTGANTPMGKLMRQYWIPAAMSKELAPDGAPMRLMLLGEKLIAFRDSQGRAGILDHRCPHRNVSLFFGRNEYGGIRCVYHGWKYDVSGACTDMMNVPNAAELKMRVRARAYQVEERNGIVWVYMGQAEHAPPLPEIEPTLCDESDIVIRFTQRECNWLQAVEGELDTSHVGVLHLGAVAATALPSETGDSMLVANKAPEYVLKETDFGHTYAAYRTMDDGRKYWRIAHFLMPFWCMPPINALSTNVLARGYIPMDDTHTMIVAIETKGARVTNREGSVTGVSQNFPYLPNTTDWYGRWRLRANMENDFEIDRELQRTKSFSGIEGVQLQDHAIQVSMGEISDRSLEFLSPSDVMVVRIRRLLLRMAGELQETSQTPESAVRPELFAGVRGGHYIADGNADWFEAYERQRDAAPPPFAAQTAAE